MSFLDDVGSLAKSAGSFLGGSGIGSSLARTALLGFTLNQITKSITKDNSKPDSANSTQPDRKVREQLSPDTNHSVPVVYGSAFVKGIITDAVLNDDQKTMWYCITISEVTGTLISTGQASSISFEEIWWNNGKVAFGSDGVTVASTTDDDGVVNNTVNGLAKIYLYKDGVDNQTFIPGASGTTISANSIFPNWASNHTMRSLAFAIVRIEYNKEKRVTSLGEISFKLKNTMTLPGDVIYDYMTSNRYGAGINPSEINSL